MKEEIVASYPLLWQCVAYLVDGHQRFGGIILLPLLE